MSGHQATVLVGTLASGENELPECREAIRRQVGCSITHFIIEGLGNREAHQALYKRFQDQRTEYDYLIKIDADMVLCSDYAIAQIIEVFGAYPRLDHLILPVRDWYTQTDINGLHTFSHRVCWRQNSERLFVDYHPETEGERMVHRGHPAPIAWHSPNPGQQQAYQFGIHRALKIVQPGRSAISRGQVKSQAAVLRAVWRHYCRTQDVRLALAVIGADFILRQYSYSTKYSGDYRSQEFASLESALDKVDENTIAGFLALPWQNGKAWYCRILRKVGLRYVYSIAQSAGRRIGACGV